VHSIVSFDFAVGIVPGWHSTIFPPFFVAGAIYSGFAMVLTIAIPLRRAFRLKDIITTRHLDNMAKVMLTSGLIVAYGYLMEAFTSWYSAETPDRYLLMNRATGFYAPEYWAMIGCNVLIGQLLWFRTVRRNPILLFIAALLINTGMWLERFVIIVTSLHRDFMPSAWGLYIPTFWDWSLLAGTLGIFAALMLLFIRYVPMISIFEMKELVHHKFISRNELRPADAHERGAGRERPAPPTPAFDGPIPEKALYGVVAEFDSPEELTRAADAARAKGYTRADAYTPFPVHGLPEALGTGGSRIWTFVLGGAVVGGIGAYFMQWYAAVISYPIDVGGRPLHSWPSFIPLTFELAVLGGAFFGAIGLLVLNRLPRPYHPIFNAPGFERASRNSFFLGIPTDDPAFDRSKTRDFLQEQSAVRVSEVPR